MLSNIYNNKNSFRPRQLLCALAMCSSLALALPDVHASDAALSLQQALENLSQQHDNTPAVVRRVTPSAIALFHASLDLQPVWAQGERLAQLHAALRSLEQDGLNPAHYGLAQATRLLNQLQAGQGLGADDEIQLTHSYLTALLHLRYGALHADKLEPHWRNQPAPQPDLDALLLQAEQGLDDIQAAFEQARPSFHHYQRLRAALVTLKASLDQPQPPQIPAGPSIREGMRDSRVPLLRERLRIEGYALSEPEETQRFDAVLVAAITDYQRTNRLTADGIVGRATLAALNLSPAAQLETLRVNLERMRWLASEHRSNYVLANIAGAHLSYVRNGETIWQTRSQVGRPARRTPLLVSDITHLTLNPTWTVPPTILRNDKLPEIRADISYLERNNMRVLDSGGRELDPHAVDWEHPGNIMLRQDAGNGNALGKVAIRFPNPFHVYLHDTPSQRLFNRDQRAFSSGCVRVEHAFELVRLLVEDGSSTPVETVMDRIASGRTSQFNLERRIPVVLSYWTAEPGEDGVIAFHHDVYGHDPVILNALKAL